MRQRHAPHQGSAGATFVPPADKTDSQEDSQAPPLPQLPQHRDPLFSHNMPAVTSSVPSTSLQIRAPRLDEMNSSFYYIPQFLWLQTMDRAPYFINNFFVPSLPPHHEFMLTRIRDEYVRSYRPAVADDVALLGRLWNGHNRIVMAPDELKFSPEVHCTNARWKELGFQGTDPSTDFRGAGVFGLTQLVYLVEKHPEQWNAMLSPDFMTAAAGLNVSLRLMTLIDINTTVNQFSPTMHTTYSACEGRLQLCRFIFDQNIEVGVKRLHEVYCFAMRLLHFRWVRSSRNLMEFNQLLSAVYAELEKLLYVSKSLEDLCSIL
ncbi:hypothetical protein ABB37_02683 [Leptomonas pyrrhocoris]|uniref:ELMO domain-containing protein n=1 Tax=Leptomonas pyrrhocoris TaxID=157538 RepID=A0A0N0VG88_LEPPY|nr:hypothetical protein ABB37_02683 [Leptomonas pyrrhocoris]KPA82934.1 hypothetical protein ABB37_02683 [Leptomonas pyrrhocoris]|eukprot:XP_015661373.1 hypothetical protein ABB37_02683 [Leptomonas pyrrhocoris]